MPASSPVPRSADLPILRPAPSVVLVRHLAGAVCAAPGDGSADPVARGSERLLPPHRWASTGRSRAAASGLAGPSFDGRTRALCGCVLIAPGLPRGQAGYCRFRAYR